MNNEDIGLIAFIFGFCLLLYCFYKTYTDDPWHISPLPCLTGFTIPFIGFFVLILGQCGLGFILILSGFGNLIFSIIKEKP